VLSVIEKLLFHENKLAEGANSVSNIYNIFFHDLVIHFSGILIQRETPSTNSGAESFPYVDSEYARAPIQLNAIESTNQANDNSLKARVRKFPVLPFTIGNSIPYGYKQNYWQSKLINILGEYQGLTKAYLRDLDNQLGDLFDCIDAICVSHSINNRDAIRRNWLSYVSHHTTETLKSTRSKLLLVGNRQDLQNRKLAINFLQEGKEVIAFTHGEIASTIFDEPMYRYAERGLCSTLVEYGEREKKELKENVLVPPSETIYRSSRVAQSRYRPSDRIEPKNLTSVKVLYIPTTYVGNLIYGPFHAYPDSVYSEWQSAIIKVLPSVVTKAHPKSKRNYSLPGQMENRWLDDCIEEYDVLILDYVATSTVLAMVTDKPIIFFDIGLRRVTRDFFVALRKRCHYVVINIDDNLDEQIEYAIESFSTGNHVWSNMHIGRFCLSSDESFDWQQVLVRVLKSKAEYQ
jgi:hypothetical protein